jgi:two-component system, chemotaxis family, CheB/CheR fusion protein
MRNSVASYGVALAALGAAVVVRLLFDPVMGDTLPLVTLFAAVAAAVWVAGYQVAVIVALLGYLACSYLFMEPRGELGLSIVQNQVGLVAYLFTCSILITLGEFARTTRRQVALRAESLRTTLASIGDAVIATDYQGRVTIMNPVAESLTGWNSGEAHGRALADVFRIINEETRQQVEDPVQKVLESGLAQGLANSTVLIAKDGVERPIDDSAAPIRCAEGELVGCVLVFRDVTERRQSERLVADARAYAENIVDTVREPLVVLDRELRVKSASRAFYQTFRAAPEETEGRSLFELGDREWDLPELRQRLEEVLPHNTSLQDYEVELVFPGLGRRTMLLDARRVHREGNHTELVLLAIEDITERKRAQETRAQLASIVESSDDAIVSKDLDGIITSWNPAAEHIFGYSAEEAIGHSIKLLIPKESHGEEDQILARLRRGERIEHYETVRRRKDGTLLDVALSVSPIADASGRIVGASKIARDITERKRAELLRTRLASIVESSDDAIVSKDLDGTITSWNPAAESIFGYSADEVIGRSIKILIPEEHHSEEDQILARLRGGERLQHYETIRRRKDGTLLDVSLTVSPIADPSGRIVGASKIARNIGPRRRAERALVEADRRKDEFLAMLAHELRNPLASISNAVQVLQRAGSDGKTVRSVSEILTRQAGQMERYVDDLLDVSRITRGKVELRLEAVELVPLLEQAVSATRPQAACLGHALDLRLSSKPIYVDADPVRLSQVMGNLLSNACKFTEHGGHIELSAAVEDGQAVVRVRDNGIGIAADQIAHIFGLFTQVDSSLERSVGGLGIGLTLVQSLVAMHGGTIEARSEGLGRGSEFIVRLPTRPAPSARSPAPESRSSESSANHRTLIIDDNEDGAQSLAMLLELSGHQTKMAHDGLQGLEIAAEFRPDVVLLDIGLPRLNGYEVGRRIRAQPWGKGMLLLAMTGWGQEEDRNRSREAGFDAHIVKPVDHDELMKLLGSLRR